MVAVMRELLIRLNASLRDARAERLAEPAAKAAA